jgi:hypothetical protein
MEKENKWFVWIIEEAVCNDVLKYLNKLNLCGCFPPNIIVMEQNGYRRINTIIYYLHHEQII